jgi:hypothetical protein
MLAKYTVQDTVHVVQYLKNRKIPPVKKTVGCAEDYTLPYDKILNEDI